MKKKNHFLFKNKSNINFHLNENELGFDLDKIRSKFFLIFYEIIKDLKSKGYKNKTIEVSLNFVNSEEIKDLNKTYRNIDNSTDVLSFPSGNLDLRREDKELDLGDIFINVDIIESQAKSIESDVITEVLFLFMHGCLHLIGYDHINEEEANLMYSRQREIFAITKIRGENEKMI